MRQANWIIALVVLMGWSHSALAEHSGASRWAEWGQARTTYLPRTFQAVDMNVLDEGDTTMIAPRRAGAAWLKRSKHGLEGRVMVNVGTIGTPYSIWWVIFNNPHACTGEFLLDAEGNPVTRCNGGDLGNPAVQATIFNASGAISAVNGFGGGVINVDIGALAGNIPDGLTNPVGTGLRRGNGFRAEVHVVVDKHPGFDPMSGDSWIDDLTKPGGGPAFAHRGAIFLPVR